MDGSERGGPDEIQVLLRQQAVLARFGEFALKSDDLDEILTEACRLVGEALGTDLAKVVQLREDGHTLLVRAGVGWKPGVVGEATMRLDDASPESFALRSGKPVLSADIDQEQRFRYPDFLKDNGVEAIANVPIIGGKERPPFGLLQVDSRRPRRFTEEDAAFLSGYANLLAAAVDRLRTLDEVRAKNDELERWVEEAKDSAERQAFLARELDHRAKNMLAVVQAVVHLTRADDVPSFVRMIDGRVSALARAQTLLAADRWSGADLHTLLRGELSAFLGGEASGPRAELQGPRVALPAGAAQPFSMAVHELATNALKYGALSSPAGRLEVTWRVDREADHVLHLHWDETGGPAVDGPPATQGFGSRVLTDTVRSQLGGTIVLGWKATGLVCDLAVPLSGHADAARPGVA